LIQNFGFKNSFSKTKHKVRCLEEHHICEQKEMCRMEDAEHLEALWIKVVDMEYYQQGIADHAKNLASRVKGN